MPVMRVTGRLVVFIESSVKTVKALPSSMPKRLCGTSEAEQNEGQNASKGISFLLITFTRLFGL